MNEIKVIDNFCDAEEWKRLQEAFSEQFEWTIGNILDESDLMCDKEYNHQYVHGIYRMAPQSKYYDYILPIIAKLNVRSLVRAKLNSVCRENEIITHGFHIDMNFPESPEGQNGCKTAIIYLNTNNGFTIFEDGTKIESVANRCVTFPVNYRHSGTTCTDVFRRVALNLVYF